MGFAQWAPAAVLAVLLSEMPLRAEDQPQLLPTRDVDITYRLTWPQRPKVRERVRWSAGTHRERVDGPDGSATVFDRDAREITLIVPKSRTYRTLEGEPRGPIEPGKGAALTRGGGNKVAGFPCTDWSWAEDGETHTVCATSDGVLLRLVIGGTTVVEARTVTYRKQKPELFEVPPRYSPALAPEGGTGP
jgi:hypothetical protein